MMSSLAQMDVGERGVIKQISGGHGQVRHLRVRGIREGKTVRVVAKQPASGPIVIEIEGSPSPTAIGRGIAMRILVEVTR
jgi:Fe2+ transport system protein FeoA